MIIFQKSAVITALFLFLVVMMSSCASRRVYDSIETGNFEGVINLQWISPEKFVFIPDPKQPFTFTRSTGEVIQPQAMFTDVGSLPRFLTIVADFSSTGYAPAYIIHDWLYVAHTKELKANQSPDTDRSALILAEGIKTLMESSNTIRRNPRALNIIYQTLKSPFARYAIHMSPWYSDLSSPENVAKMGAEFYQSQNFGVITPSANINKK